MHGFPDLPFAWPGLEALVIVIGGTAVTCEAARLAAVVLRASRTSAVLPVLSAAGSPLASCDYFAASAPWVGQARSAPKTGRAGAAGRHVVKEALIMAIEDACERARRQDMESALAAFASDERYAVAMAQAAGSLRGTAAAASLPAPAASAA